MVPDLDVKIRAHMKTSVGVRGARGLYEGPEER